MLQPSPRKKSEAQGGSPQAGGIPLRRSSRVRRTEEELSANHDTSTKSTKSPTRQKSVRKSPDRVEQRKALTRRSRRTSSSDLPRIHNTRSSTAAQNKNAQIRKEKFPYEAFLHTHLPKCSFGYIPVYKNYGYGYPEKPCYICGDTLHCPHSLENLGFTSSLTWPSRTNSETTIMCNFIRAVWRWKEQRLSVAQARLNSAPKPSKSQALL